METELQIAAKWWGDVIQAGAKQDNGDPDPAAQILMSMVSASQRPVTDEQRVIFEQTLIEQLQTNVPGSVLRGMGWGVDYHPDAALAAACKAAGISENVLPIKTLMFTEPGLVRVRYGYGAPLETLYLLDKGD